MSTIIKYSDKLLNIFIALLIFIFLYENFDLQKNHLKISKEELNIKYINNLIERIENKISINGLSYVKNLKQKELNKLAKEFYSIKISHKKINDVDYILSSTFFEKIKIDIEEKPLYTHNLIYFSNKNMPFTIETKIKRSILDKSINTQNQFIFNILVFLIIIGLFIYKYQDKKRKDHENLEQKVENRTRQITNAMNELKKVNNKLYDIAHTDFLTKTMNRRNFFLHAKKIYDLSKKEDLTFSALMIDIDNFKTFNDQYGHDTGDKVLILFSQTIKKNIPREFIFGRLGGEEFALIMPNTILEESIKKAEELKSKIEEIDLHIKDEIVRITASFGVSDNSKSKNIDEVLQKADKLLYNAKTSGKNLVRSRFDMV